MGHKCVGTDERPCPDAKSGLGVKKCQDNQYRCDKCRKDPPTTYVCNELLCYAMNNSTTDELANVIRNFYNEEEIDTALELLRENYDGQDNIPTRDSVPTYDDVITIIINTVKKSADKNLPKFVAADLKRIPTSAPDQINVMSLFTDISMLRTRLDSLAKRTCEEVNAVKQDVKVLYTRTQADPHHKPRNETETTTSPEPREPRGTRDSRNSSSVPRDSFTSPTAPRNSSSASGIQRPETTDDGHDGASQQTGSSDGDNNSSDKTDKNMKSDYSSAAKKATRIVATGTSKKGLEASKYESAERLFISFLKPDTTESMLQSYIRKHIGCDATCEKLRHRMEEDFSQFKVTIRKRFVDNLFKNDVWPEKVVIDYYKPYARRRGRAYQSNKNSYNNRYQEDYDNHERHGRYKSYDSYRQNRTDEDPDY